MMDSDGDHRLESKPTTNLSSSTSSTSSTGSRSSNSSSSLRTSTCSLKSLLQSISKANYSNSNSNSNSIKNASDLDGDGDNKEEASASAVDKADSRGALFEERTEQKQKDKDKDKDGSYNSSRDRVSDNTFSIFPLQDLAYQYFDTQLSAEAKKRTKIGSFESIYSGKRKFWVSTTEQLVRHSLKDQIQHRHYYEIIRENHPCRAYFDMEFKFALSEDIKAQTRRGLEAMDTFIALVTWKLFELFELEIGPDNIVILDSCSDTKFSKHIMLILPRNNSSEEILFKNNIEIASLIRLIMLDITEVVTYSAGAGANDYTSSSSSGGVGDDNCAIQQPNMYTNSFSSCAENTSNSTFMPNSSSFSSSSVSAVTTDFSYRRPKIEYDHMWFVSEDNPTQFNFIVDLGVYSKNRAFRLWGSCKFGKTAILHCNPNDLKIYSRLKVESSYIANNRQQWMVDTLISSFVVPADLFAKCKYRQEAFETTQIIQPSSSASASSSSFSFSSTSAAATIISSYGNSSSSSNNNISSSSSNYNTGGTVTTKIHPMDIEKDTSIQCNNSLSLALNGSVDATTTAVTIKCVHYKYVFDGDFLSFRINPDPGSLARDFGRLYMDDPTKGGSIIGGSCSTASSNIAAITSALSSLSSSSSFSSSLSSSAHVGCQPRTNNGLSSSINNISISNVNHDKDFKTRILMESKVASSSPFVLLDTWIPSLVINGGTQGKISGWLLIPGIISGIKTVKIRYLIAGNRFCFNIGRQHKSNNIMIEVDLMMRCWSQICWDPNCKNYRSQIHSVERRLLVCNSNILEHLSNLISQFDPELSTSFHRSISSNTSSSSSSLSSSSSAS